MHRPQYHHHHHHHHHHYHHHYHRHQDILNSFKNTCGCCGCYCCKWNLSPLVQSRIFSVSTFYFIMIIHPLLVSSGSCNCPLSWIYIQLVSRSSREQTPHCISKEGECNKMNKCTKKEKKRKVRKPEKTLAKSCMGVSAGPKAHKNDHFCTICLLLLLLFLCVYVLSKWTNKCETDYKSKCN